MHTRRPRARRCDRAGCGLSCSRPLARTANQKCGTIVVYTPFFRRGKIFEWPREHKKPNALLVNEETKKWLMPKGWYAITRRFSAKEERRRLVAFVVDPRKLPGKFYGFENHLNVVHSKKRGVSADVARGVALF
jgi:adenine-specific DNA-methyltransferase